MQYGVYYREMQNGKREYVLAFAGTQDIKDIQQDINQALGGMNLKAQTRLKIMLLMENSCQNYNL